MKRFYAGLDIGSSVCELVVVNDTGEKVYTAGFSTSERNLVAHLKEARSRCPGELHLAFEEGEMAHWVAGVLRAEVTRLVVCDPKRNAWIARDSGKNDKVDAYKLALLLKGGFVREVYHTQDQDRAEFKRAVQHYHDLTVAQASLKCQIKSKFRAHGLILKGRGVYACEQREESLSLLTSEPSRQIIRQLYEMLDTTVKMRKEARGLMTGLGRKFPEVPLFEQVPGIGPVWACTFSGYIQTPFRFRNKRKLWRFCELGITNRKSNGEPLGYQRLDRSGVRILKALSFQAFGTTQRGKNEFRDHYLQSMKRTQDPTHARLSTQRKILAVLYGMWKRNEPYHPGGEKNKQEEDKKIRA